LALDTLACYRQIILILRQIRINLLVFSV
jgi:hypothetical protein